DNDSIYITEKIIGQQAVDRYAIRQQRDSQIDSLPCDPMPEELNNDNFFAEQIVSDNAAIYTAAQVADGVLYYGNSAGEVKAYNVEHKEFIWIHKFTDPIYSTPVLTDELVIVPTLDNGIVALNHNSGKVVWQNNDGNRYIGNGVVDSGYLYIGTLGVMRKIDCKTGKTVWSNTFGTGHPQARPTIAEDKLIFGAWDCHLYCIDCQSGTEIWRWSSGSKNRLLSPGHIIPRVGENRVMIVAPDRYMTNIDLATGKQIWRVKERKVRESTGLSSDGKIFYAKTMDGEIIAVPMNSDSYTELWCSDAGWGYDHSFCPLNIDNNIIYMANRRGKVAAIAESGEVLSVGKFADSAANDLRADGSGNLWVSFIEGTIWRLKINK
ncbi:MAG: PQQ-binding-like beta-propeller repeat protein, partial [Alistipes sp.]|nr:PQQ-binding-like beta-propeller repeat protein [Alistipes sp.]